MFVIVLCMFLKLLAGIFMRPWDTLDMYIMIVLLMYV